MEDPESVRPQLLDNEDDGGYGSEGQEGVRPKVRRAPDDPTQDEIDEHNIDHGVFRSWCPHCVRGGAVAYGHKKKKEQRLVPVVSIDYMYMTDRQRKEEYTGTPILIVKDETKQITWAHAVPHKGRYSYAIERLRRDLDLLGHNRLVLRSDPENAVKALKAAVKEVSGLDIVNEEGPVGAHQANGLVEAAVKQVQGQVRALKDALETRIGERISGEHPCIPWMIQHAASTMNRRRMDERGMTPYRTWTGRDSKAHVAEFGERVWYLKSDSAGKNKLVRRWEDGVWMGIRDESGESIIGTSEGVVKCRDFRRRPEADRWRSKDLSEIKGTPWQPTPGRDSIEIKCKINMPSDESPITEPAQGHHEEGGVKRAKIFNNDLVRFGYTVGCPGCRASVQGKAAQSHNEECRRRIESELRKENSKIVQDADERMKKKKDEPAREEQEDETGEKHGRMREREDMQQDENKETTMMRTAEEGDEGDNMQDEEEANADEYESVASYEDEEEQASTESDDQYEEMNEEGKTRGGEG